MFADIIFQVKELNCSVFVILQQFVFPAANSSTWTLEAMIAVVGKVPVDGPTVIVFGFLGGNETSAVDMLIWQSGQLQHFQQGRVVIRSRDERL